MLSEDAYNNLCSAILPSTDCESQILHERSARCTERYPDPSPQQKALTHFVAEASTSSSVGTGLKKLADSTRSTDEEHVRPTILDSVSLVLVIVPILAP